LILYHYRNKPLKKAMSDIDAIQAQYEANKPNSYGPSKAIIDNILKLELDKLTQHNLKNKLTQWTHFRDTNAEIEAMRNVNNTHQQYVTVIENNISEILAEVRNRLADESKRIESAARKKAENAARRESDHEKETLRELSVLYRMNRMPEDLVRVIGEFAFTPKLRLRLIESLLPSLDFQFRKVKLPKLKTMARCLSFMIQKIAIKIQKNKNLLGCIPPHCDAWTSYTFVINCPKIIRETLNKPDKIAEIDRCVKHAQNLVGAVEKLNFPINTGCVQTLLLRVYNIINYASRPEFNRRGR
jgi:hypothetical protein